MSTNVELSIVRLKSVFITWLNSITTSPKMDTDFMNALTISVFTSPAYSLSLGLTISIKGVSS